MRVDQKVLVFAIDCLNYIGFLSGFTGSGSNRVLSILSATIRICLVLLVPVVRTKMLSFAFKSNSIITTIMRECTSALYLILLVVVFTSETLYAKQHEKESRIVRKLFTQLVEVQSVKENIFLLFGCTFKLITISSGLCVCLPLVFEYSISPNQIIPQKSLYLLILMFPYFVLTLASNRIYVGHLIIRKYLMINARDFQSTSENVELRTMRCANKYSFLYAFFARFNKLNLLNLITIMSFCSINIITHVTNIKQLNQFNIQAFLISGIFSVHKRFISNQLERISSYSYAPLHCFIFI